MAAAIGDVEVTTFRRKMSVKLPLLDIFIFVVLRLQVLVLKICISLTTYCGSTEQFLSLV